MLVNDSATPEKYLIPDNVNQNPSDFDYFIN